MSTPKVHWSEKDCCQDPLRSLALRWEIAVLLRRGTIKYGESYFQSKGVLLNLFPCSKAGWQLYPILDGQQLDKVIKVLFSHAAHSRCSPGFVTRGPVYGTDLKVAYFHVPEAPPFRGTGISFLGAPIQALVCSPDFYEVHSCSTFPFSGQGHADSFLLEQ